MAIAMPNARRDGDEPVPSVAMLIGAHRRMAPFRTRYGCPDRSEDFRGGQIRGGRWDAAHRSTSAGDGLLGGQGALMYLRGEELEASKRNALNASPLVSAVGPSAAPISRPGSGEPSPRAWLDADRGLEPSCSRLAGLVGVVKAGASLLRTADTPRLVRGEDRAKCLHVRSRSLVTPST